MIKLSQPEYTTGGRMNSRSQFGCHSVQITSTALVQAGWQALPQITTTGGREAVSLSEFAREVPARRSGSSVKIVAAKRKMFLVGSLAALQLFIVAGLWQGCRPKATDEVDFGSYNKIGYTNHYFGMTVPIPADWSVQDQAAQQRLTKLGQNAIAGSNKNLNAMLKASDLQSINLFGAFQYPLGTPGRFNPSIMGVAEQVRQLPGIQKGRDYLEHVKQLMQSGQMEISFPKAVHSQALAGVDFDVMEPELKVGRVLVKQEYFATILKGYALSIIISYSSDAERVRLHDILDKTTFDPNLVGNGAGR